MQNKIINRGGKLFLVSLFLIIKMSLVANAEDSLLLNEIFPNPEGSDTGKEFVELYNNSNNEVELSGWILRKVSKKGKTKEYKFKKEDKIEKNEYLTIKFNGLNNNGATISLLNGTGNIIDEIKYNKSLEGKSYNRDEKNKEGSWYWAMETKGVKNVDNPIYKKYPKLLINEVFPNPKENEKENEFIELYNPNKEEINLKDWILKDGSKTGKYIFSKDDKIKARGYFVIYRKDYKFALNNSGEEVVKLLDPNDDNDKGEYKDKIKYKGSVEEQSYNRDEENNKSDWYWAEATAGNKNSRNLLNKKYPKLIINEILPNPKGDEKIAEFIELYNPNKEEVNLKGWALKDSSKTGKYIFDEKHKIKAKGYFVVYRKDFKFALNNSGGEVIKLIAPNQKTKSEVEYQSTKENISYNFDLIKNKWRWSKFLTPGTENKFNHLPIFKLSKPKKVYKNVYAKFEVDNLKDKDGDKIKVTWDFGDGHKSYLKKTKHKFRKTGKYKIKLSIRDGSEETVKEFKIEVKKYPKYKLKIIEIMPNPVGKDKGKEIIVIKNLSKKKINLKKYKIATGKSKKKISKHPFYDDFKIKPGKTRELNNNDICKFNLLNSNGMVQLIYPDGSVADKVKYAKKKILPGERYKLNEKNKQWYWQGIFATKNKKINNTKVVVLGEKTSKDIDVTLDNDLKICKTTKQIKKDNWLNGWTGEWLF